MAPLKSSPKFAEWLAEAIPASGLSKREIARRMAATHPRGVTPDTVETGRRTINKILSGDLTPTQPTRDSISAALERVDGPPVSADHDGKPDLEATLQAIARETAELNRRVDRALRKVTA